MEAEMEMKVQRYSAYKDSGVEWLGEIPEGWEVAKLRNIGVFSSSGIDKYLKANESKVKIINFTDVYGNTSKLLDSKIEYMVVTTPESNRIQNLVRVGDLIFLPSSETYDDLGTAALVNEELINTSFSYHVIRFVFKEQMFHSFKKYVTNNNFVLQQFSRQGKGTTRKIIGRGVFKNIKVLIPPIDEQTAIANFLDKKTALIEQAISVKEKQIELLKERKQIIIQNAVTKGLDPNVRMKDSRIDWIGQIPEGWGVEKGKWIYKKEQRQVKSNYEVVTCFRDGEVTLRSNRRTEGFTNALKEHGYQGVLVGDFIIHAMDAFAGAIGVSDSEGKSSPVYSVCTPRLPNSVNSHYYAYLLRYYALNGLIVSLAKGIRERSTDFRFKDFGELEFQLPPIIEQNQIVKYIEEQSLKIDKAMSLQEKQIEKLKEYKATLIDNAVTGKIKVS